MKIDFQKIPTGTLVICKPNNYTDKVKWPVAIFAPGTGGVGLTNTASMFEGLVGFILADLKKDYVPFPVIGFFPFQNYSNTITSKVALDWAFANLNVDKSKVLHIALSLGAGEDGGKYAFKEPRFTHFMESHGGIGWNGEMDDLVKTGKPGYFMTGELDSWPPNYGKESYVELDKKMKGAGRTEPNWKFKLLPKIGHSGWNEYMFDRVKSGYDWVTEFFLKDYKQEQPKVEPVKIPEPSKPVEQPAPAPVVTNDAGQDVIKTFKQIALDLTEIRKLLQQLLSK